MNKIDFFLKLRKLIHFLHPDQITQDLPEEILACHEANAEATAHHEAGHAVADYIFGIPIECASIIPDKDGSGYVEISKEWKKRLFEEKKNGKDKYSLIYHYLALEKYCGGAAETKFRGCPNEEANRTDRGLIEATVIPFYSKENSEKILKEYENKAAQIMANPDIWRAVQSVAQALLERKKLTQSELKEICDKIFNRT